MMRLLQIPLWWTIGLALAIYASALDRDFATLLVFALAFGTVFGGGMAMLKPASQKQRARRMTGPRRIARRS